MKRYIEIHDGTLGGDAFILLTDATDEQIQADIDYLTALCDETGTTYPLEQLLTSYDTDFIMCDDESGYQDYKAELGVTKTFYLFNS